MRSTKGSRGSYTQTNSFTFFAKEENIKENNLYLLYYVFTLPLGPVEHCFFNSVKTEKKNYLLAKQSDAKNKNI